MWSSSAPRLALVGALVAAGALAQEQAQGFAVERLYQSAPGGGWLAMDDLSLRGGLGGAVSLTVGAAHHPLEVAGVPVVSDAVSADIGGAITYRRFRLYFNLSSPLYVSGQSGVVGATHSTGAHTNLEAGPDLLSDPRVGFDALVFGSPRGLFRMGAGAQLIIPSGKQEDFITDGTFRGMGRILFAGDLKWLTWAAQLGVHLRPRDDAQVPSGPRGSELLFGAALGARWAIGETHAVIVGPEVFGATALRSPFGTQATALEALLAARFEGTGDSGPQLRVKVGVGAGLIPAFGAPQWRLVLGVEMFDRGADRDGDLVPDDRDACPDTPGPGSRDPKTNGCPPPS